MAACACQVQEEKKPEAQEEEASLGAVVAVGAAAVVVLYVYPQAFYWQAQAAAVVAAVAAQEAAHEAAQEAEAGAPASACGAAWWRWPVVWARPVAVGAVPQGQGVATLGPAAGPGAGELELVGAPSPSSAPSHSACQAAAALWTTPGTLKVADWNTPDVVEVAPVGATRLLKSAGGGWFRSACRWRGSCGRKVALG